MRKLWTKQVIINLAIVISVFIGFVLLDINLSKASPNPPQTTNALPAAVVADAGSPEYNFKKIPPFDWNKEYYVDHNILNTQTNFENVKVNSNETKTLAFYSYRKAYYRFEVEKFILKGKIDIKRVYIVITKDGKTVNPYLAAPEVRFWKEGNDLVAYWFADWKTPTGKYEAVLHYDGKPVLSKQFQVISRPPYKFNRTMNFLTLESNIPIYKSSKYNHLDEKVGFKDLVLDWMNFGDLDGFLILSGETAGFPNNGVTPEKPWEKSPLLNLKELGTAVHDDGKLVGAYIMCFYTPENGFKKAGYAPAKGVTYDQNGQLVVRTWKFTSFKDPKRYKDIVELAAYFNTLPYVDMIGFDFIRFGENVGYENADEFVRQMNIPVPVAWVYMTEDQQALWLGGMLKKKGNIKKQWQLWKAHKTAEFIYKVRTEAQLTKPVWAFTLGWEHGEEHGQDPALLMDAGLIADFPMLYEATPDQFAGLTVSWKKYLKKETLNYIPGNQIDAKLMKSVKGLNPIEEYYYRLSSAVDFAEYQSKGVFIHDIARAFWGRTGGYSYHEWLNAGLSAASYLRWKKEEIPFMVTIDKKDFPGAKAAGSITVPVTVHFTPSKMNQIIGKKFILGGAGISFTQKFDITSKTNVTLYIKINPNQSGAYYFAVKGMIQGYPSFFTFRYLNFNAVPAVPAKVAVSKPDKKIAPKQKK
ncbi:MAG: hypothetical protein HPY53_09245 [Brevinematales bacterium]|nr:hypothetical protein [Brevinematales bacterium]